MLNNFYILASNNLNKLNSYNLKGYIDAETYEKSQEGGDFFMKNFLSHRQNSSFLSSADLKDDFEVQHEKELVNQILHKNIALLIIRPEMTHYTKEVNSFLKNKGIKIIKEYSKKLSSKEYWALYHRGITHPNARYTMATRTLVYTSSNVRILICKSMKKLDNLSIADMLFYEMKGKAGTYQKDTLRGDLIYKEAKRIGLNNQNMDSVTSLAIDPFSAYKYILDKSDISLRHQSVSNPEDKLLAYTSVSIHIPNLKELGRDLSVLFNKKQLLKIYNI